MPYMALLWKIWHGCLCTVLVHLSALCYVRPVGFSIMLLAWSFPVMGCVRALTVWRTQLKHSLSLSPKLAELIEAEEGLHTNVDIKQLNPPRWVDARSSLAQRSHRNAANSHTSPPLWCPRPRRANQDQHVRDHVHVCQNLPEGIFLYKTQHKHAIAPSRALVFGSLCMGEIVSLAAICVQYGGLQSEVMHYVMHTVNSASGQ